VESVTHLARALHGFAAVVARIADPDAAPTRCEGWTVADVVGHVIAVTDRFTAFAAASPSPSSPSPSPDLATAVRRSAAWRSADGADGRRLSLSFGTFDAATAAAVNAFDALVHGWDVAAANGIAYEPDADLVAAATAVAERLVWQEQQYRRPPPHATPATPLERLLVVTGRGPEARGLPSRP